MPLYYRSLLEGPPGVLQWRKSFQYMYLHYYFRNHFFHRRRHSVDVIKALRDFLTKSWRLLEQNTMQNIENPHIGGKDAASSYTKSLAEHAETSKKC